MGKKDKVEIKDKKKKTPVEKEYMEVPLIWHTPDNMISRYATNVAVQVLQNELKISFFETKPEINVVPVKTPPKNVRADCVASIIISPHTIPQLIEALKGQYNNLIERKIKESNDMS